MSGKAPVKRTIQGVIPARDQAVDGNFTLGRAPFDGTVTAVTFWPDGEIAGHATARRDLDLKIFAPPPTPPKTAASLDFVAGVNAMTYIESKFTLSETAANLTFEAGNYFVVTSDAVGAGVADPGGLIVLEIERA